MPVSGIPDPEQHRICIRCGQWFDSFDGEEIPLDRNPIGKVADAISGDVKLRFQCDGCTQRLERSRLIAVSVLAGAIFIAVLYGFWLLYQK